MRAILAFAAASILAPGLAYAGVGTSGAQTLEQVSSARSAGLAEADTAGAVGAEAMGCNPAGLVGMGERGHELLAFYQGGFAGDRLVSAVYAQRITPQAAFGAGVASYNSGSIEEIDALGYSSQLSGQRDIAGQAGCAVSFAGIGLSVGASVRFLRTQLLEDLTGNAFAGDMGVRWEAPVEGLVVGAAGRNLGAAYKMGGGEEPLPMSVRFGLGYSLETGGEGTRVADFEGTSVENIRPVRASSRLEVMSDASWRIEEGIISIGGGLEYSFRGVLAVRAGYRGPVKGSSSRDGMMALGVGLDAGLLRLDYAAGIGESVALHRVSVTLAL